VQKPRGVSAVRLANITETYKRALLLALEANKRYPRDAQRRGVEGQVEVAFVVLQDGTLQQLVILRGSGSRHLDRAALQTLKRLHRFRPIPDELSRREWPMRVILRFALQ
jgi:protein TonB